MDSIWKPGRITVNYVETNRRYDEPRYSNEIPGIRIDFDGPDAKFTPL